MRLTLIGALATLASGCVTTTTPGGATEIALCNAWGNSLPTRSQADTAQTKDEIQQGYAAFAAVCPEQAGLIP